MIWESASLMAIIDLLIISASLASLKLLLIHRTKLRRSGLIFGPSIVVAGLTSIGLFYVTDLFTMFLLPLLTTKAAAAAAMENLHLNYSWIVVLVGTFMIFRGFTSMNRSMLSTVDTLERSETTLKDANVKIGSQLQRLETLREIGLAITSTLDLPTVLDTLLRQIDHLLPYPAATVRLFNRENGELENTACLHLDEEDWKGRKLVKSQFSKAVIESKRPVIRNVQTDADISDPGFFQKYGLVSNLAIPLIARGKNLGILNFYTRVQHQFSGEEVDFLCTIAGEAAIAIYNSQLFEQVEKSTQEISALHAVTATTSESLNLDTIMQKVIEKITEIFHFDATRIFLVDPQRDKLHLRASFETHPDLLPQLRVLRRGQGIPGWVLETGGPLIFENALSNPRYQELSHTKLAHKGGYSFIAAFPVKSKSKTIGTIVCIGREPRRLTSDEIQLITAMADQIGVSVENANLFEEVKTKSQELAGLVKINSEIAALLDRETLLSHIAEQARKLLNMDAANFRLIEGEHLVLMGASHPENFHFRQRTMLHEGVSGRIVRENRALAIRNILENPSIIEEHREMLAKAGLHGFLGVPLQVRGRVIGVIMLLSCDEREFSQKEIDLLTAFADQAAIAIANANLFEETRDRAKELSALYSVATAVNQSMEINIILRSVMEKVLEIFHFDAARVYLFDDDKKELYLLTHQGFPKDVILPSGYNQGTGIIGRVFVSGEPLFFGDIRDDPEYRRLASTKLVARAGFRSTFLIPIGMKGKTVGVINFLSISVHQFLPNEIRLIQSLTNQIGVALENARLYKQTKEQAVLLEKDIIERKRAEGALRQSEATTRSIVDNTVDGIITINEQGIVGSFNRAAEKIFGYAADEVIGQNVEALMPESYRWKSDGYIENYLSTGEENIIGNSREVVGLRKDGTTFPMDLAVGELQLGDRRMFTGIVRDISARKHAEEKLQVAQKQILAQQEQTTERVEAELSRVRTKLIQHTRLAAIGQVSASIAHELRNPLGAVRNAAYLLRRCLNATDPKGSKYLGIVEEEVYRADRIIGNLIEMSRGKEPNKQAVELAALVREVYKTLGSRSAIKFICAFVPEPFVVWCDWGQLWQVFSNLFTNALQAMENSGTIKVEGLRSPTDDVITVKDSGPGITNEDRERIFEPLYTTKAKGTGLGLTICRQIIVAHGGRIEVVKNSRRGTAISFQLPRRLAT